MGSDPVGTTSAKSVGTLGSARSPGGLVDACKWKDGCVAKNSSTWPSGCTRSDLNSVSSVAVPCRRRRSRTKRSGSCSPRPRCGWIRREIPWRVPERASTPRVFRTSHTRGEPSPGLVSPSSGASSERPQELEGSSVTASPRFELPSRNPVPLTSSACGPV